MQNVKQMQPMGNELVECTNHRGSAMGVPKNMVWTWN
jgi:hypothetical protein